MPAVVSETPVNKEICGEAALYFAPYSVSEIVSCLRKLDSDPALRRTLSEKGRRRAVESYSWESHVSRLADTFRQVKDGSGNT